MQSIIVKTRAVSVFGALLIGSACNHSAPNGPPDIQGGFDANTGFDASVPSPQSIALADGWLLQTSKKISDADRMQGTLNASTQGWIPLSVPSTVLAALTRQGVYPDPDFGMNLTGIPGTRVVTTGSGQLRTPGDDYTMPANSPFLPSWWYRKEFQLPSGMAGRTLWLRFAGINYRARIYLNGSLLADENQIVGTFRSYELDVTKVAANAGTQVLAVEVFAPENDDLDLTWVDWNPFPPDKNMGIWGDVTLLATGPIHLRWPQVKTHLDLPNLDVAHLTATVEAANATDQTVSAHVSIQLETATLSQDVSLAPHETKAVSFTPDRFAALQLAHPRIWWPAQMGTPELYQMGFRVDASGQLSEEMSVRFGIREITSELTPDSDTTRALYVTKPPSKRLYRINGKPILIRGAGFTPDMMLRISPQRLEDEVRYVADMNLNTIRLEGRLNLDHLIELCDQYGILVMPGWNCCDGWSNGSPERLPLWPDAKYAIAKASLEEQMHRLRNHPSILVWLNGSDDPPIARDDHHSLEQIYLDVEKSLEWPNPILSSADNTVTTLGGWTGVKMTGPYLWVPPIFWYSSRDWSGAWGFLTETGTGIAIPPVESLKKFLPPEHLWPIDNAWYYHSGNGDFEHVLEHDRAALEKRYGGAAGLDDFVRKAQLSAYEAVRAMFESFSRNKYVATGVIQWMLNNAWPAIFWHLYDYFLKPGGGYFGAKKACEPLHIQYSYDNGSIVVVNSTYRDVHQLTARASVLNADASERYAHQATLDAGADTSTVAFTLPSLAGLDRTYFLRLLLVDAKGAVVSRNWYWLSTQPDVFDEQDRSTGYIAPARDLADFSGLAGLPPAKLQASATREQQGEDEIVHLSLKNSGTALAFFLRAEVTRGQGIGGEEILPVRWDDNDVSLAPGESMSLTARYRISDRTAAPPSLRIEGWNLPTLSIAIQ